MRNLWFNQVGETESLWFNATSEFDELSDTTISEESSIEEEEELEGANESERISEEDLAEQERIEEEGIAERIKKAEQESYIPRKGVSNLRNQIPKPAGYRSKYLKASKFEKQPYNVKTDKVVEATINTQADLDIFLKKAGVRVVSQGKLRSLINKYQEAIYNGVNLPPTEIPVSQGKKKKGKLKVGVTCCPPKIYIKYIF